MARVKALRLGKALAKARQDVDLSLRDAAERVGWKHHRLHNMEQGKGPYHENEIATLLGAYGVMGTRREQLLMQTRTLKEPVWWEESMPSLPNDAGVLAEYEAEATRIVHWSPLMIPGLLQTMDYTRAWLRAFGHDESGVEIRLTMRIRRQQVLHENVRYVAYLTDHALQSPRADTDLNRAQLTKLLEVGHQQNVDIRMVPIGIDLQPSQLGGFTILEFADSEPLVLVEHLRSAVWMTEDDVITPYLDASTQLESVAVDATEPIRRLLGTMEEHSE